MTAIKQCKPFVLENETGAGGCFTEAATRTRESTEASITSATQSAWLAGDKRAWVWKSGGFDEAAGRQA